jgi:ribonuclease D
MIVDRAEVQRLVEEARSGGILGLDTEFMREKTYRARLCLVQVSTRQGIYVIDPLEDIDVGAIAELVGDPEVDTIVHAGRQDFEIFYERFDVTPSAAFDVQLAAGFAGYGASLPYGRLVEAVTGTTLVKGESYTDWCRRPLTDAQLRYAADDVRYLLVIADVLRDKLNVAGRLDWATDEMAALQDPALYDIDLDEIYKRVSGRGNLSGKQMAVLRELARWREEMATSRDIPRGWVIKDQTLIEMARRSPKSVGDLKNLRGMGAKEAERSGAALLAAIERGRKADPIPSPRGPSRTAQARARALVGLADAIVRSRSDAAGIANEIVTTRGELEALLADVFDGGPNGERHRLLTGWRRDLVGDALVDLAKGRVAVRSIDNPPYIEEVPLG